MTTAWDNVETVEKLLTVVDAGLTKGKGTPTPGDMCVEAAVCFALGEPHGDNPTCVGAAVRAYKIGLNDATGWISDDSRAKGMRRVAVAQLGSNTIDQARFAELVAIRNVNSLLADTFEVCGLDSAKLRGADSLSAAESAARSARSAAWSAAESAAESAVSAAESAARSAAWSARSAAWSAAWSARSAAADAFLCRSAEMIVQILIEMECPGTKWLYLTETT